MKKSLKVSCPQCKKIFDYYTSEKRPFCSKKCKMIDLGRWFEESYAIKGQEQSVYIEDKDFLQNIIDQDGNDEIY